ncbi:hypothetical protein SAMD00019534_021490 [Acytostelium subglobosum LB1]|uniref:hypothetical protein n=1 Tax=Acytostelium subglobosum LB1 TaxID=1410327 RepID=UPI000644B233|nr:hypothetical protein SAMD00019534_021490 [Acytostelium subglobosum LB1]GAM18974.1 hypothetical protein SAMD00019534_021490 [Acytostelium subglobosum LB1]|eukprot:XP_012756901.1 hypothetical protein SAMD00019534_021490 [Acytostelium subglobosum LB1]
MVKHKRAHNTIFRYSAKLLPLIKPPPACPACGVRNILTSSHIFFDCPVLVNRNADGLQFAATTLSINMPQWSPSILAQYDCKLSILRINLVAITMHQIWLDFCHWKHQIPFSTANSNFKLLNSDHNQLQLNKYRPSSPKQLSNTWTNGTP